MTTAKAKISSLLETYNLNLPKNKEIDIRFIENGCFSGPYENDPHAKEAYHYLSKAIALGDSQAHFYLARLFLNGWGVKVDIFRAMEHATQAATQKDPHPLTQLSLSLLSMMVESAYLRTHLISRVQISIFGTTNQTCKNESPMPHAYPRLRNAKKGFRSTLSKS